jgi:hypothetical protein
MILYDIKYQLLIFFTICVLDLRPQEPFPFDIVIAQEIAEELVVEIAEEIHQAVDPEDVLEDIRGLFMEYDDGVAYLEAEVEIGIAVNKGSSAQLLCLPGGVKC